MYPYSPVTEVLRNRIEGTEIAVHKASAGAFFGSGERLMKKDWCEVCGNLMPGLVSETDIVPRDICRQAGIGDPKTVRLCERCRRELGKWYSSRVADTTFDASSKRFRSKTPAEMVQEYAMAYQWFSRVKQQERVKAKR